MSVAVVAFPYHSDLPVVDVTLTRLDGSAVVKRLLVDSGFTGRSALVLPAAEATPFVRRWALDSDVRGAVTGQQRRGWVRCQVPILEFRRALVAIWTDLTPLALPPGVEGVAGLTFLNQFARWGGEQSADGTWRFTLTTR